MRSVRQARKSRDGRGKQGRSAARGAARGAAQPQTFGRRRTLRNDPISRALRAVRGFLDFRRPMLVMTLVITLLTALAAPLAVLVESRRVCETPMQPPRRAKTRKAARRGWEHFIVA